MKEGPNLPGEGEGDLLDLVIVGGGPVGLVAGLLAHAAGLRARILEREPEPLRHSRAIGIHPPAVELLHALGVAEALVGTGTQIRRGHALAGPDRVLGSLDFGLLPGPWRFILTLPQWRTEAILERRLREVAPGTLVRGVEVSGAWSGLPGDGSAVPGRGSIPGTARGLPGAAGVRILPTSRDGSPSLGGGRTLRARFVLACDGKESRLRSEAGIPWTGRPYAPSYVMGDFPTAGGVHPRIPACEPPATDAAIYLHREGLVESFPLEEGVRRWVAQVDARPPEGRPPGDLDSRGEALEALVRVIRDRCGVRLDPTACRMVSAFGAERYRAERFWEGRLLLGGDAAHVVSPIGGQGMNLGWLNTRDAVEGVAAVLAGRLSPEEAAASHEARAGRRFREVARRAEQNMLLGHRSGVPGLRNQAIRVLLHSPARKVLARRFSMLGV